MPKKAPTPIAPELLAQFWRELTPDVIRHARGYAEKIVGKMHSIEGSSDPSHAAHLVGDAITDTIDGIRAWDPARRKLLSHLCSVVQSRLWAETQRAMRRRHVAYHPDDDDASGVVGVIETEMSLRRDDERRRPEGLVAIAELRRRVYAECCALAAKDPEILAMLDAHQSGSLNEPEVIEHLGWTKERYFNVWRRFDRMRRKLPAELREVALEALTRGPVAARLEVG